MQCIACYAFGCLSLGGLVWRVFRVQRLVAVKNEIRVSTLAYLTRDTLQVAGLAQVASCSSTLTMSRM